MEWEPGNRPCFWPLSSYMNLDSQWKLFSTQLYTLHFNHWVMSDSLPPHGLQHARLPCPSPTPRARSNSCPLSWWCHPTISSSVVPFSVCLQSFPASGSFQMSQLFASGGQSIGVSASASVLPMNIQDWFSFGLTGLIALLSKGPHFKSISSSVLCPPHGLTLTSIHNYRKNHSFDCTDLCWQSDVSAF